MPESPDLRRGVRIQSVRLYRIPVATRMPYHFGTHTLTEVDCLRVAVVVERADGARYEGWGETPLSVGWAWPGGHYFERLEAMNRLIVSLGQRLVAFERTGHPLEISHGFQEDVLTPLRVAEGVPYLAALVCLSAFDLALYDAYGKAWSSPVFATFGPGFLSRDLASFLEVASGYEGSFVGRYPADYLQRPADLHPPAWHAVGGGDPLESADLSGAEPDDGYPVLLRDWIRRDGIDCLKIKLSGQNYKNDYRRITRIGAIARESGVSWLCTDFNSTVREVSFVTTLLDQLEKDDPETYQKILYVEQPFFYEMEDSPLDVHPVSAKKPLFMDESAHDWKQVREGRERGWTGVALKTCKTLTNAILMLCWAREHGMPLMVQDLTNPMLAQITHAQLAAHAGTVMGLETNSMQYYPNASNPEALVHPGLFRRRDGRLDLSSIAGPGFGYRLEEIARKLPAPFAVFDAS